MKINKILINEDEIIVSLSGYGCNSNSCTDCKELKIKHSTNLEGTLSDLGVKLI